MITLLISVETFLIVKRRPLTAAGKVIVISPAADTYNLRVRRQTTTYGLIMLGANSNVSGGLTQPDNSGCHFYAYRLEV